MSASKRPRSNGWLVALLVVGGGCAPSPPPALPAPAAATTTVITTAPSATAGAPDLHWVRNAVTLDLTYAEGTVAGSFEFRAHVTKIDRTFEVDETLDLQCPPSLLAKCTATHRTFHRSAELPGSRTRASCCARSSFRA